MYALVLVGGRGERLRPYTEDRPKAMVSILGRPLLEYHLTWLRENGVSHALLLCGYLHQVLRDYFGDGGALGLRLEYVVEEQPLGRGGAFKQGFTHLPAEEKVVLGTNGDILTSQPLAPLLEAQRARGAWATVLLAPLRSPYGIVDVAEDGRITGFREKPELPYWLNAGVYVLDRACAPLLPEVGDHETTTFPRLAQEGKLFGFCTASYWRSIDTVKDLTEVSQELPAHFPVSWLAGGSP